MTAPNHRVRRATLDDIVPLRSLWAAMRFTAEDLERRLTEFQVVEDADGKVVGALGFEIHNRQARIHSEAFADFAIADAVRPMFWGRMQSLAMNHGIVRLWTQEHAPYWTHNGFQPVNAALLEKLPPGWDRTATDWLALQLKEEAAIQALSADEEFAAYIRAEKERTAARMRASKRVGWAVALVFALIAGGLIIYVFIRDPGLIQRMFNR